MKHRHHIVPVHAGGSNDDSNLVELTVAEHSEAHRLLFQTHGKLEDYLAWQGLAGHIGKEEIIRQMQTEGARRGGRTQGKIQGRKNAESGFINTIATFDSLSKGGKAVLGNPKYNYVHSIGGKTASVKNIESGQLASLSRKVISVCDGKVISYNNKHWHEKKTGYKHIWIDL